MSNVEKPCEFDDWSIVIVNESNEGIEDKSFKLDDLCSKLIYRKGSGISTHILTAVELDIQLDSWTSGVYDSIRPRLIISDVEIYDLMPRCAQCGIAVVNSEWLRRSLEKKRMLPMAYIPFDFTPLKDVKIYISRYSFNEQEYKFLSKLILMLGGYVTNVLQIEFGLLLLVKDEGDDPLSELTPLIPVVNERRIFQEFIESNYGGKFFERDDDEVDLTKGTNGVLMFRDYHFIIDLQMAEPLIDHLSRMIRRVGGKILPIDSFNQDMLPPNTIYLGDFYGNALFNKINCSIKMNIAWVMDCIIQQRFITPSSEEMYYQIPSKTQNKLCDGMEICYTQFFGLERYKIIEEIEMLGGTPVANLDKNVDVLIVGMRFGDKYVHAYNNNIPMVNSQWLTKTFQVNKVLPFGDFKLIPRNLVSSDEDLDAFSTGESDYGNEEKIVEDEGSKNVVITSSVSSVEDKKEIGEAVAEIPLLSKPVESNINEQQAVKETSNTNEQENIKETSPGAPSNNATKEQTSSNRNPASQLLSQKELEPLIPTTPITDPSKSSSPARRSVKRKRSEEKAEEIISHSMKEIQPIYDIHCVATQCLDKITEVDKEILKLVGITIYDEITDKNITLLNAVIAPRRLRTMKFLLSFSFEPLRYALLPTFITDLLKLIKNGSMTSVGKLYLDIEEYRIPEMDPFILAKTSLESKVFSRANITAVNIPSNIQGGTKTLKTILQRHGIETINVLKKKFTQEDVISNPGATQVERETGTTTESPTNESNEKDVPEYILITDQQSQMKQFKNLFKSQGPLGGTKVLVVEWNWCVQCIFSLEVSYSNSNPAVLYYE